MQSRAAIRYAKAIYEIADEENFIKEIFNDMIRINNLNRDSSDFKNLLSNSEKMVSELSERKNKFNSQLEILDNQPKIQAEKKLSLKKAVEKIELETKKSDLIKKKTSIKKKPLTTKKK